MRYKVFVGSGFALGFLAGAWAGRDRYNAVMRRVRGFKDHPSVHATAGLLQAQAVGAVGSAKRAVTGTAVGTPGDRGAGMHPRAGGGAPGSANGTRPGPAAGPGR